MGLLDSGRNVKCDRMPNPNPLPNLHTPPLVDRTTARRKENNEENERSERRRALRVHSGMGPPEVLIRPCQPGTLPLDSELNISK